MKSLLLATLLLMQGALSPQAGVITGQVLNNDGTPAAGVRVSVMPVTELESQPGTLPSLSNLVEADSTGSFRIQDVIPGRYYVVAGFVDFPTFYPGVRELVDARVVNVTSSATVTGINFRVAPASGGMKVSGRVMGLEALGADARSPITVSMYASNTVTASVRPDGSFEFPRVPPGEYMARVTSAIINGGSDDVSIKVSDKDVNGVELQVYRLREVAGKISIEGRGPMPRLTLTLGVRQVSVLQPEQDGTFKIMLPEGERSADLRNLPPGYTVKSFTYGNADLTRQPLRISSTNAQQLQLTLSTTDNPPVKVSGRISGAEPTSPMRVAMSAGYFVRPLSTPSAADGTFEFSEVFPGDYTIEVTGLNVPRARKTVTVVNEDIKGVEVVLPGRREVRGRILVDGDGPLPRVALTWSSTPWSSINATWIDPGPDGTFRIALYEGDYWGTRVTLPRGYALKSLRHGSVTLLVDAPLKISNDDMSELQIGVSVSDLKPVKVSGRAAGVDPSALARWTATVSMKSSSYAETLTASVAPDGSYEFPKVFPGNYSLVLKSPDVPANTCVPVIIGDSDSRNANITVPRAGARNEDIRIISAIFGTAAGSADVTPLVTKWVKPDLDEFYAAPKWLEVDPAIGQTKHLVVSYLFQCEEYVITTTEPGPVSYAILAEHARPSSRPAPVSVTAKTDEVTILASHYGMGNQFRDVTPRVRELLGSGGSFVVDDAILNVNVNTGGRVLVITYSYRGERKTLTISKNTQISRTQLAANAESEVTRYHSSQPPAWLKDADPFAPREPGDPGPGFGQQARRELAIASLLQAVAELKAIAPQDSNREIATTTSITQQALADAQANINRPYPPPSSKPIVGPVRPGPKSLRLANATRALQAAQEQLASAGGGPNELFLGLALEEIQQALAGLRRAMEVR